MARRKSALSIFHSQKQDDGLKIKTVKIKRAKIFEIFNCQLLLLFLVYNSSQPFSIITLPALNFEV